MVVFFFFFLEPFPKKILIRILDLLRRRPKSFKGDHCFLDAPFGRKDYCAKSFQLWGIYHLYCPLQSLDCPHRVVRVESPLGHWEVLYPYFCDDNKFKLFAADMGEITLGTTQKSVFKLIDSFGKFATYFPETTRLPCLPKW